jgi:hypothetical protein
LVLNPGQEKQALILFKKTVLTLSASIGVHRRLKKDLSLGSKSFSAQCLKNVYRFS